MKKSETIILIIFVAIALLGILTMIFDFELPKFDFGKDTQTEAPSGDATEAPGTDEPSVDLSATHVWGQYTLTKAVCPEWYEMEIGGKVKISGESEFKEFTKIVFEPADYYLVFYNEGASLGYIILYESSFSSGTIIDFGEYALEASERFISWLDGASTHSSGDPLICPHNEFNEDSVCETCGRSCSHEFENDVCLICGYSSLGYLEAGSYLVTASVWENYETYVSASEYSTSMNVSGNYNGTQFDSIGFYMTCEFGPYIEVTFYSGAGVVATLGSTESWSPEDSSFIYIEGDAYVDPICLSIFEDLTELQH